MGCNVSHPGTAVGEKNKNDTRINTPPSPVVAAEATTKTAATAAAASTPTASAAAAVVREPATRQTAVAGGTASGTSSTLARSHTESSMDSRTKPQRASVSSVPVASAASAPVGATQPYREPFSEEPIQECEVLTVSPHQLAVYNERVYQCRNRNSATNVNRESNRSSTKYDNDCMTASLSSNFSVPQLFRISPTQRAQRGEGTWEWWYEQVDKLRITKDCSCRARLEDIQNRLIRQYDADKGHVELDLGYCYMERSAPYVLGRLLASPFIAEIRWITALRLDGNYFTDEGFGNMLAVMSMANESQTILPLLKELYLNNMNLDPNSVHGILFYLFPLRLSRAVTREANTRLSVPQRRRRPPPPPPPPSLSPTTAAIRRCTIAGESVEFPLRAYIPFHNTPHTPLFPSLEVLSLCDNPGIGNRGLAVLLRCLIAPHYERRELLALDLSRCGIDEVGMGYLREYLRQLPISHKNDENVVTLRRVVLIGNRHSMDRARSICSNDGSHFQLNDYDNNINIINNKKNGGYGMRNKDGSHYVHLQSGNDDDLSSRDRDISIVL